LRLTLEAEALEEKGIADATLLERALESDATNARARSALQRFERGEPKRSENARYVAAGSILALALAAIAWLFLRRKPEPLAEPALVPSPEDASLEPSPESEAGLPRQRAAQPELEPQPDDGLEPQPKPQPDDGAEPQRTPEPEAKPGPKLD
jgi:hypothetical protein